MPGNDLVFYGTTGLGGSDGDNVPDTSDWLGRHRAQNTLHEVQSTLTSSQSAVTDQHIIVDTARIGDGADAHVMKWVLIQTGAAALSAARVQEFDTATGQFVLDRPLDALASSGDEYAIFAAGNCFPNLTAQESEDGQTLYRCVFMRNEHGVAITEVRFHLVPLMADMDQWARMAQAAAGTPFLTIADEETAPLDSFGQRQGADASDNFSGSGGLTQPIERAGADAEDASLSNNTGLACYLRRVVPAGAERRRSVAIMLVASSTTAGSDPDPLVGAAIIVWDVEGVTPSVTAAVDRFVHFDGGGRYEATVVSAQTGDPVTGREVKFKVDTGDPGSVETTDNPITDWEVLDDAGEAAATYRAPSSGVDADVIVEVPHGEEVGDP